MIIISYPRIDSVENDVSVYSTPEEARAGLMRAYFNHSMLLRIVAGPDWFRDPKMSHKLHAAEYEFLARIFHVRCGEFVSMPIDSYEMVHLESAANTLEDKSEFGFPAMHWLAADFFDDQYDIVFDGCTSPYGRPQITFNESLDAVRGAIDLLLEIYDRVDEDDFQEDPDTTPIDKELLSRIDVFCFEYRRSHGV